MDSRLKALELQGYKTFASRILLEFPGRITAIVGPNGSGKSNVADSIRWVLGEQSFSLLRGRKTEDMIFAGSEQRARAGMASASITFDNSDGWLPIDFTEVSIARRAYRDGQNDYLLNGQRVRLKEITELLAQSGLAERTYTIIGQGLVDAALSLKPDERRRFFEEAAGIGLYRGRREESVTRLENTRHNLERARDILSELEPRLQSLEKQAKRAQEYKQILADLRLLLRDWYGYHWRRIQQEIVHTREALRTQEAQLSKAQDRLTDIESELSNQRNCLLEIRSQLNTWHNHSAELHRQREIISRNLAIADERHMAFLREKQGSHIDLLRLHEEIQVRSDRLATLLEDKDKLSHELKEAQNQVNGARQNLLQRQADRAEIEKKLHGYRHSSINTETRQIQIKARQAELNNRLNNIQKSRQSLSELIIRDEETATQSKFHLENAIKQKEQLELDLEDTINRLQSIRNLVSETEAKRRRDQEDYNRLATEHSKIKTQIQIFEQAEKSFSGLNQGARYILQSSRQGKITGKINALTGLLEVPAEYETAISASLGEFLDGILFEEAETLVQALQILENGEKGRSVLLPLTELSPGQPFSLPTDPDLIGLASDLVNAPSEITPVLMQLLGQTIIVKNRTSALRLRTGLQQTARIVTLAGEVFYGNGIVIAGQDGRAGVVGQTRQKRELKERSAQLDDILNELDIKVQKYDRDLDGLRNQEKEADGLHRQKNKNLEQANQSVQQIQLELERIRQRQDWQRSQLKNNDDQIQQTEKEARQLLSEIKELDDKLTNYRQQIKEQNRLLDQLPLDDLKIQVAHWETNTAVNSQAIKGIDKQIEEINQLQSSLIQQEEILAQRQNNFDVSLKQLEFERKGLRMQEDQINKEIDLIQQQIQPTEKNLQDLEDFFARKQTDHTSAQQGVTIAERHVTQVQMEFTRHREALESLRRKIEDDFGLVAFDFSGEVAGQTPLPLEGMVEQLPVLTELPSGVEDGISRHRSQLRRMGSVNLEAQEEYLGVLERYNFLSSQITDLKQADADLRQVIAELDDLMRKEFRRTFSAVAAEFRQMFTRLFGGGSARLIMTDEDNITETGIDIEARLPGRREQGLSLLSGGERSLTAVALIFALLKVSPTPFCVLDEVDAMLDEANVGRFCELLTDLSQTTQFIIITHNRNTVQTANVIYGITMSHDSASQMISLKLDEISEDMVK